MNEIRSQNIIHHNIKPQTATSQIATILNQAYAQAITDYGVCIEHRHICLIQSNALKCVVGYLGIYSNMQAFGYACVHGQLFENCSE